MCDSPKIETVKDLIDFLNQIEDKSTFIVVDLPSYGLLRITDISISTLGEYLNSYIGNWEPAGGVYDDKYVILEATVEEE